MPRETCLGSRSRPGYHRTYAMNFPFDIGNFVFITVLLSVGMPILITIAVIVVIVWSIRRSVPTGRAAAEMELRGRMARGEISPTEYQARLDSLQRDS